MPDGAVKIHQTRYIDDMVAKFGLESDTKKASVPYKVSWKLCKAMGPQTEQARKETLRKMDDHAETSKVSSIAWADFVDQSMTPPPEPTHRKVPGGRRSRRGKS